MVNLPDKVTTYRANQRHDVSFFDTLHEMCLNVLRSKDLIWQLFKRDFFAQYRKSFLGSTWIFISPVVGILSWLFLQMSGVLTPGDVGIPYPAYVLVGTSMWGLFMSLYQSASNTLISGSGLITQVNYPHEALFFQQLATQLANFIFTFTLNLIVLFILRLSQPEAFAVSFPTFGMLWFPLVVLPLFFVGSAFGLIASMVNVVASDIGRVVNVGLGFGMYVTPIIYSSDAVTNPLILTLIEWNPLTYLICSARDILIYGQLYNNDFYAFAISSILAFLAFLLSWRLFYVSEQKLVERMI